MKMGICVKLISSIKNAIFASSFIKFLWLKPNCFPCFSSALLCFPLPCPPHPSPSSLVPSSLPPFPLLPFPTLPFFSLLSSLPSFSYFSFFFLSHSLFDICLPYISRNNPVASHINVPLSYCNSDCNCDESHWEPVCGANGVTYMSPCLAGCKSSSGNKKSIVSICFYFLFSPWSKSHIWFTYYLSNLSESEVSSKKIKEKDSQYCLSLW